jgi:hypothetical protein
MNCPRRHRWSIRCCAVAPEHTINPLKKAVSAYSHPLNDAAVIIMDNEPRGEKQ